MIDYKIIDNALSRKDFLKIKEMMTDQYFTWNVINTVANNSEQMPNPASYYFIHMFWEGLYTTDEVSVFIPVLEMLGAKELMRVKGNLFPSTDNLIHHEDHFDYPCEHRGAILYLNTNDGLTVLENEVEVESVENRLLLFDPSKMHHSTTCTTKPYRMNVNFNFF